MLGQLSVLASFNTRAALAEEGRQLLGPGGSPLQFQLPCPRTPLTPRCPVYCGRFGGNYEAYE